MPVDFFRKGDPPPKIEVRRLTCRKTGALTVRVPGPFLLWSCPACKIETTGTFMHFGVPNGWVRDDGTIDKPAEASEREGRIAQVLRPFGGGDAP